MGALGLPAHRSKCAQVLGRLRRIFRIFGIRGRAGSTGRKTIPLSAMRWMFGVGIENGAAALPFAIDTSPKP